jgi:hypothetical protein
MAAKAKLISIVVVLVIVAAGVAGVAGYTFGVKTGQTQAANTRSNFLAQRGVGGNPPAGTAPGFGGGAPAGQSAGGTQANVANFAMGQVKQVDGTTIQLSTATEVLKVKVSDQTQIQKMGQGSIGDIQAGERITVQGTRGADGSFTAQMIQIGGGIGGGGPAPAAPPSGN